MTRRRADHPLRERRGLRDDLTEILPVPAISEHDGGRYVSAGVLICRDTDSGRLNMAICRLQIQGPDPMSRDRMITKVGIDATLPAGTPAEARLQVGVRQEVGAQIDGRWAEIAGNLGQNY